MGIKTCNFHAFMHMASFIHIYACLLNIQLLKRNVCFKLKPFYCRLKYFLFVGLPLRLIPYTSYQDEAKVCQHAIRGCQAAIKCRFWLKLFASSDNLIKIERFYTNQRTCIYIDWILLAGRQLQFEFTLYSIAGRPTTRTHTHADARVNVDYVSVSMK